jgi:hypothetical protein
MKIGPRPRLTTLICDNTASGPFTFAFPQDSVARWMTSCVTCHTTASNQSISVAGGIGPGISIPNSAPPGMIVENVIHAYKWLTLASQQGWQVYQNDTDLQAFVVKAGEQFVVSWERTGGNISFHGFFTLAWNTLAEWRSWRED